MERLDLITFPFPFGFPFTFSFHTSEGYEGSKLELDSFPNAFVVFGLPFS
jgi:hypothetical protein